MDHIIVTPWEDDYFLLVPEEGYRMKDTRAGTYHSEAIAREKDMRFFIAE